ncbi:MAG: Foldase protein PrsA 2 [Firmicutes bacterium]|nr:Foldase protein PrsA 2 [candidate division NPL-UPA2 bacterium]
MGIIRVRKWMIAAGVLGLLGLLVVVVISRFYVAYADGFISRRELDERLNHVQFAYDLHTRGTLATDKAYAESSARSILEQLIVERFLLREAVARGVAVTAEERTAHVNAVREWVVQQYFTDDAKAFEEALATLGLAVADFDEYVADSLLIYRLRSQLSEGITVSEADARAYFEANRQAFNLPEMIRLRHVLVAEEREATGLLRSLRAGEDFAAVARKFSRDIVSAELGGDLNWRRRGEFPEAFEAAAWALARVNDISEVVKTAQGYHIIRLEGKQPLRERTFAEVQELVRERLREGREADLWDTYLAELRRRYRIFIFSH